MDTETSDAKIYGYTLLIGAGVGCSMTAGFAVAQTLVSASDLSNSVGFIAIGTCINRTFRVLGTRQFLTFQKGQMWGQIVVLSVGGSIYQNISLERLRDAIPGISNSGALQLTTGTHGTIFESLSSDSQDQVVHIVTDGMRYAFALLIPITGLALIGSLFLSVSPRNESYLLSMTTNSFQSAKKFTRVRTPATRPKRGERPFVSLVGKCGCTAEEP